MSPELPSNMLVIDTAAYERRLFAAGHRGVMNDAKTGQARASGSTLSLESVLQSIGLFEHAPLHNAGNDAYLTMLALQLLLDPKHTTIPSLINARRTPGVRSPHPLPVLQMPTGGPRPVMGNGTPPQRLSGVFGSSPTLSPHGHTPSPGTNGGRYSGYLSASPNSSPNLSGDYFGDRTRGGTGSNRNSRRVSAFVPDEMGGVRERKLSGGPDKLSRSLGRMTLG